MNNDRMVYENTRPKLLDEQPVLSREVSAAMEYIAANYAQPLPLKKIAEQVHLSPGHFSKLFKAQTGMFITSFVNGVRLHYAEILIRESDIPTYIIGRKVGIKNKGYFLQLFKEQYGQTPMQYRKTHRSISVGSVQYPGISRIKYLQ